ncbi:MAG: HD-GYP domain-containing protein [Huintestinicola sp.]
MPEVFLEQIVYGVEEMLFVTIFIVLQRILFLEYNTPKQKKTTNLIIAVFLAVYLVITVLKCFNIVFTILDISDLIMIVMPFAAVIYSSVTGRKKAKWLGVFVLIPVGGYYDSINQLIEIPIKLGAINEIVHMYIYRTIVMSVLLGILVLLSYKKPRFIRNLERDIENRSLSFWEELVLWVVGIWLFFYNVFSDVMFPDSSADVMVYLGTSNFIVALVIVILVVDSNYRNYYYKRNLTLQKSLITTMADLVENRDENTGGHIQRTAKYVEVIARKLRSENKFTNILTEKYIENMVIAAPLHDVGKIHIPDSVLNKAGRLDENEFATMKSHASEGGKIINHVEESVGDIEYLCIAKEMAEYHHERIDGKGYPHGISGDEIPLCARILAVADVFDALASKRCYKEAMPLDKAFAIISEESGTHFDAEVAKAFLDSRSEVEEIVKNNS